MAAIEIRRLGPDDAALLIAHPHLFDAAPRAAETASCLADPAAFILFAMAGADAVGFLSANVIGHPDKVPSLFINELGVEQGWRRRGIATALVRAARDEARTRGLEAVWVATDGDDALARSFYDSLDGATRRAAIVYEWSSEA